VTKSVLSLLNYYGWHKFSIIYEEAWLNVAKHLESQAIKANKTINHIKSVVDRHKCCELSMDCCRPGHWFNVSPIAALRSFCLARHFDSTVDLHIFCSAIPNSLPSRFGQNQIIQNTMNRTRIYIFLGTPAALVDMMVSMEALQLFDKGEYMVIFVDTMSYSPE
jgi:guanylate cyclase, other